MMREIDDKLCYADHIRFRGVCKSWRAGGGCEKRAGDVLPWLMLLDLDIGKRLLYKLYEPAPPPSASSSAIISCAIHFGHDYFDDDMPDHISSYGDGWVNIYVCNNRSKCFRFSFFSVATRASLTIPQLDVYRVRPIYLGLSTTPNSPDCVFLALHVSNDYTRTISIFRHGDTYWTSTTKYVGGWFGRPDDDAVVFIRGVFYFFFDVGIGSYDLATGILKVDRYSTHVLEFSKIHKFFGLDGDLMLAYDEKETLKFCISKYDWSNKVWVPLLSLGGRSLYLSRNSVYVDQTNYYGISSANKIIYAGVGMNDEYTFEDGQLSKCPSARWAGSYTHDQYTQFAIWVCPPDVLLRKG